MNEKMKTRGKILIVGPLRCGKSCVSNYVADTVESSNREYRPTKGVRILELESADLKIADQHSEKIIELWDCSGDRKYESCWPALRFGAQGTVLVVDPERTNDEELLLWYNEFVVKTGLRSEHVLILLHHTSERTNDSAIADFKLPQQMVGIHTIPSNIDHEGEALKTEFNNFLLQLFADLS
uniref:Intraflagellar transport protein 22 homolog n=1 Tax=Panagrolaimus sp. JU765 TaxID=591449 RepID=A0AC34RIP8_9BILA